MVPGIYIHINKSTKHPTFSFVPWKLSVPAIVWMREAVRTVSSLYFIFKDGVLTDDGKVLRAISVKGAMKSVQREALW